MIFLFIWTLCYKYRNIDYFSDLLFKSELASQRVSNKVFNMTDVRSLEHPTLKVPYEVLNKRFRIAQKHLDREVNHVTISLTEVERSLAQGEQMDRDTVVQKLETLKGQLEEMKNKGW